ncbi:DUF2130 domain-containing protein [Candidatus Saccharibacteria bacterium]|nr:DUF2130 domain-containing protein [Candidatus Saccharibacteria bacterium]
MNKIKCPHCQQEFEIDESSYANILSQVRSQEFDKEIHDKLTQIDKQYETELKLSEEKFKNQAKQELAKKDTELIQLKAKKDDEINAIKIAAAEEISKLKSQLDNSNTEKALAVSQAIIPIEKERDRLKSDLKNQDTEAKIREQSLKDRYEGALQLKNEEIERLKELKSKLSTKMVGETLEQHCEIEFNKLRATGFQNAYFEKDNEVSKTGSKGDYIYRETDENGTEIISIMFEMKNENETTATKHKNEDFLKELDKDRTEKKCEYAILVSLLEADNELYNTGIVDVSYRYPKMYVIRPQFFIPMITVLRNAALNSLKDRNELIAMKSQEIDITNFENEVFNFKESLGNTLKNFYNKHSEAIEQINKAIKDLEKTRDALILSDKHIGSAENKLEDLTIKRLTRGNPTMAQKFEDLKSE